MLHAMIMAGGGGTRFWPRSRSKRPKQFLTFSGDRTLLQGTIDRVAAQVPPERTWVITGEAYVAETREQLPEVPASNVIGEPEGRDTAPCCGLGAAVIGKVDPDATIAVMPADHAIEPVQEFRRALHAAEQFANDHPDKLITFGMDREAALQRMAAALGETALTGVKTNVEYLQRVVTHPAYIAGGFNTHFVEDYRDELNAPTPPPQPFELIFAACADLAMRRQHAGPSPWQQRDSFRMNLDHAETLVLQAGTERYMLELAHRRNGLEVSVLGQQYLIAHHALHDGQLSMVVDGECVRATVFSDAAGIHVLHDGRYRPFTVFDPLHAVEEDATAAGSMTAPIPGAITAVMVQVGDRVARGAPLIMLEAMKIEHTIVAPFDGVVTEVRYAKGEQVAQEGAELIKLEPAT
mgnify:CR=1 FL=1